MSGASSPRFHTLDALRGLCVLSMVAYHGLYDLVAVKGYPVDWYFAAPGQHWQRSICCTFILLSGACWNLSRRHWQRGLLLVGCGGLVTLVTALALPSQVIWFGILVLLGLSCLLTAALARLPLRVPPALGLAVSFALFLVTWGVPRGFLGLGDWPLLSLPPALYSTPFLAVAGFPGPGFVSSDYFPLLPWFFLYLTGVFLGKLLFAWRSAQPLLEGSPLPGFPPTRALLWVGRHSLLIYLLHQPLLMLLFLAVPAR